MNAELKEKWLEALESGRYTQGRAFLNKGGNHCCLGVLADIMGVEWIESDNDPGYKLIKCGECGALGSWISIEIQEKSGLKEEDADALTFLNDRADSYAPAIAYIREKL